MGTERPMCPEESRFSVDVEGRKWGGERSWDILSPRKSGRLSSIWGVRFPFLIIISHFTCSLISEFLFLKPKDPRIRFSPVLARGAVPPAGQGSFQRRVITHQRLQLCNYGYAKTAIDRVEGLFRTLNSFCLNSTFTK